MMKMKISLLIFLVIFAIGCSNSSKTNEHGFNEYSFSSDDIKIYDINAHGFSYEINNDQINIDKIELVYNNDVIDIKENKGIVDGLLDNTTYKIRVYYFKQDSEIDIVEVEVKTAFIPEFSIETGDDHVSFCFEDYDIIDYLIINETKEYNISDNTLTIDGLDYETVYSFKILYRYLGNDLSVEGEFKTKEEEIITILFAYPFTNNLYEKVLIKKGETIVIPNIYKSVYGYMGDTYVFDGFDTVLDNIDSDKIVKPIYIKLEIKSSYELSELYTFINEISISDIERIEVWNTYINSFEPYSKKYSVSKDNYSKILNSLLDSSVNVDENYEVKYGSSIVSLYIYLNNRTYSIQYNNNHITINDSYYLIDDSFTNLISSYKIDDNLIK